MEDPKLVVIYSHSAGQNVRVDKLPERGKTVWAKSWLCDRDGAKGTNVAVSAARLGTPTALVSKTGNDFWAQMADRLLEGAGVNTDFLVHDPAASTPTGVVFVDEQGDNSIVLSPEVQALSADQIDRALNAFPKAQYAASGYELQAESANLALQKARAMGIKTALNPSPVPKERPDFSFVDLLFVNEHEAAELLSLGGESAHQDPLKNTRRLKQLYGCRQIVITLGGHGYAGIDQEQVFQGSGLPVSVVDTSGAGDGFMGAVLSELIRGRTLKEACAFANYYSSMAVQTEGTIPGYLTRAEMEKRFP